MSKQKRNIILGAVGLVIVGFLAYVLLSSLGGGEGVYFEPTATNRVETQASEEDAVRATNTLGFQLIGQAGEDNLIVSNVALSNLMQLYVSANEDHKKEMDAVMSTQGDTQQTFAALNNRLEQSGEYQSVGGFWMHKDKKPGGSLAEAGKHYRTYLAGMDLTDSTKATGKIGEHMKKNSDDQLQGISSLPPDIPAVLAGGEVFAGEFAGAFAGVPTQRSPFKGLQATGEVDMMGQTMDIRLYEDDKLQFASIPLKNDYTLELCLPKSFAHTKPTSGQWNAYSEDAIDTPTQVNLPKMELYSNKAVEQMLAGLGLEKVFAQGDGLGAPRVDNSCKLSIAPAGEGQPSARPAEATLNCALPFYFAVRHDESGTRILTGQYTNPQ